MDLDRARRVAWVSAEILPLEPAVRRWLKRSGLPQDQIDDLLQEAYCRFAGLASVDHILSPSAYFFQVARTLRADALRRSRVVSIDSATEIDSLNVLSEEPSPERVVAARRELDRVLQLIERLPDRCRKIVELRKIQGLSQKEIAARLGITETIVENEVVKGIRIISRILRDDTQADDLSKASRKDGETRNRRRD